jgi:hypothetical protein
VRASTGSGGSSPRTPDGRPDLVQVAGALPAPGEVDGEGTQLGGRERALEILGDEAPHPRAGALAGAGAHSSGPTTIRNPAVCRPPGATQLRPAGAAASALAGAVIGSRQTYSWPGGAKTCVTG